MSNFFSGAFVLLTLPLLASCNSNCKDILSTIEASPIKNCSDLIGNFPCGSVLPFGGGLAVNDFCNQTCGLCDDSSDNTTSSSPFMQPTVEDENCMDILSTVEASPIKNCSDLIDNFPCGSILPFGGGMAVNDFCNKTCGLCGNNKGNETQQQQQEPTDQQGGMNQYPFQVRYTPHFVTDDSEYTQVIVMENEIEFTSVVPANTLWFGYTFYRFDLFRGDPNWDMGYFFTISPNETTVSVRSQWMRFIGSPSEEFLEKLPQPVFHCTEELAAIPAFEGKPICDYYPERGEGDMLVSAGGQIFLVLKDQEVPDAKILDVRSDNNRIYITWSRSRAPPLDKDTSIRIRYARTPREPIAVSASTIEPLLGFPYHRFSRSHGDLNLFPDNDLITVNVTGDGLLQHEFTTDNNDGKPLVLVGGSHKWNRIPNGFNGYADLDVPVGTILRFTYIPLYNVATVPDQASFDSCDIDQATVAGESFEGTFDFPLESAGEYFFITSSTRSRGLDGSEIVFCKLGIKVKVRVSEPQNNEPPGSEPPAPQQQQSGVGQYVLAPIVAFSLTNFAFLFFS